LVSATIISHTRYCADPAQETHPTNWGINDL
jgi:hypothetical protein